MSYYVHFCMDGFWEKSPIPYETQFDAELAGELGKSVGAGWNGYSVHEH